MKVLDADESCSFLRVDVSKRGSCHQPRSCASCLETTGCVVSAMGQCVSFNSETFDPTIDFRKAFASGLTVGNPTAAQLKRMRAPQSWQFPAGSVRYCNASDAVCSACVRNNFWRSASSAPDSRFCVGGDGLCVCVDVCERTWYTREDCGDQAIATGSVATDRSSSTDYDEMTEKLWRGIMALTAVSLVLMLVFLHKKCSDEELQRVRQQRERLARRNVRERELGVNALTLTGWQSYRRELIDKEKAHSELESNAGV